MSRSRVRDTPLFDRLEAAKPFDFGVTPPLIGIAEAKANLSHREESTPVNSSQCEDPRELADGCRVVWRDSGGHAWHGQYRFTLGPLASIVLDEDQPGLVFRAIRVDPATLRREPRQEAAPS